MENGGWGTKQTNYLAIKYKFEILKVVQTKYKKSEIYLGMEKIVEL